MLVLKFYNIRLKQQDVSEPDTARYGHRDSSKQESIDEEIYACIFTAYC